MKKSNDRDRTDPASMGGGDAQLDGAPPNVEQAQPPADSIVQPPGTAEEGGYEEASASLTALNEELEAARRDLRDVSERHLRLAAEFDNYRKRVERERQETWSRAQADFASRLLDALDDLERVTHHSESATAQALLDGVQLVEKKLRTVLSNAGLEAIDADNARFDPNTMEAVAMVPVEDAADDDVVSDVFQKGYRFNGQLLRPARVRVKKHH